MSRQSQRHYILPVCSSQMGAVQDTPDSSFDPTDIDNIAVSKVASDNPSL